MLEDRVRQLKIHVRAGQGHRPGLQADAQRITRIVLARVAARLEAGAPQRLVFIRELLLHWRIDERQLTDDIITDQYARDIHGRLENETAIGLEIQASDAARDVAVFDNESQWRAAHLLARSRNGERKAWFFKDLEAEGDPLDVLSSPHQHALAWQVLEQLASRDCLVPVIRASSHEKLKALAENLLTKKDIDNTPAPPSPAKKSSPLVAQLVASARRLPANMPPPVVTLALHAQARAMLGAASKQVATVVNDSLFQLKREYAGRDAPQFDGDPQTMDSGQSARQSDNPTAPKTEPQATEEEDVCLAESVALRFGGLFYLLNCALELKMGEILWKACLPEQQVFAHALAALLGQDMTNDASIALFAECRPDAGEPQVSAEQLTEVSEALLAAIVAALPRRGLAEFPQTVVEFGRCRDEPLLVVRPAESPLLLFARPAPTPAAACTALEAFLAGWSRSAPAPLASPGIAELDRTGRTRPRYNARTAIQPLLPRTGSATTAALLAQTIGVMCHLLEARSRGAMTATSIEFVERYLRLPAQALITPDQLTIVIPAGKIDIQLRRAGLDRDPGWAPWLAKTVRFQFVAQDEDAPGLIPKKPV